MSQFRGCGTALVTPFLADGSLDEATFRKLVRRQVLGHINFLVPCGTTGESPTLSHADKLRVVEITLEEANGTPVLAGAGGYDTAEIIRLVADYRKLGVQGILSVTPCYNKPTQAGLIAHFTAIAESTDLPILLYSVQPRTNVNIEPATVAKLSEVPNIFGIKEASGSVAQVASILNRVPEEFQVFSGDDAVTIPIIALGGHGIISVASNQIPEHMTQIARYALEGDFATARQIHRKYLPLMEVNFCESSPQPLKASMALMGLLEPHFRLPLVYPQAESVTKIEKVLREVGLL